MAYRDPGSFPVSPVFHPSIHTESRILNTERLLESERLGLHELKAFGEYY